jgi:predicted nucleic acid-binding Zn ribbon protein
VDSAYRHLHCFVCDGVTIRTDSAIISTQVHVNSNCKMHYPLHVLLKSLNAIIVTVLLALPSSLLPLKVTPLQLAR